MGHLNELYAKYKDKGVVLLSVTNEPRGLVDKFVEQTGAKFPIVIESGDSGTNFAIKGYPSSFVIGPDGKIAGNTFDPALIETLIPKQRIMPALPEKFASVAKLLEKNKLAEARKSLETLATGKVTDEEKQAAADVIQWIDEGGPKGLESAAADEKAGDIAGAAEAYAGLAADYAGLEPAVKAAEALKALLADPAKKKEVDGAKALAKAQDDARGERPKKAIPFFKSVVSKFKDTKAGQKAAEILAELEKQANK